MTFFSKIWNSCPFSSFYTTFIDVFKLGTKYTTKILINYTSISSFWENQKPKSWHFIFFIYTINYRWMVTEIYNNVTFLWAIKIIFLPESRIFLILIPKIIQHFQSRLSLRWKNAPEIVPISICTRPLTVKIKIFLCWNSQIFSFLLQGQSEKFCSDFLTDFLSEYLAILVSSTSRPFH